jgi:DMSO reductase anchor subunit
LDRNGFEKTAALGCLVFFVAGFVFASLELDDKSAKWALIAMATAALGVASAAMSAALKK